MSVRLIITAPSAVRSEDEDAAYRADIVTRYFTARDFAVELRVFAEATAYDKAHPDAPSLTDELLVDETAGFDYPAAA